MDDAQARALTEGGIRAVVGDPSLRIPWERAEEQRLSDLGVTSLTLYDLVSVLEDLGGFRFRDEDVDSTHFRTLASVKALLAGYSQDAVA